MKKKILLKIHPEMKHQWLEPKVFKVRRSTCKIRPPFWHSEYMVQNNAACCLLTKDGEPSTFHEAIKSLDKSLWMT